MHRQRIARLADTSRHLYYCATRDATHSVLFKFSLIPYNKNNNNNNSRTPTSAWGRSATGRHKLAGQLHATITMTASTESRVLKVELRIRIII